MEMDPYVVLGLAPNANDHDIKSAYRRAARRLHPDVNQNNPGAAVQFSDITAAHELLTNVDRRVAYDREAAEAQSENQLTLGFRITPSKRVVGPLSEPQVIYLLAEIIPDPRARDKQEQKHESRLNLTLVLDHSNSMNGSRIDEVKVAAHRIIDQLSPDDIFSVVGFNDFSEVLIPATPVKDKAALKARVSMMNASGGTEIFKGLEAGIAENRTYLGPRLVNHIVLLTDGNTYGDQERSVNLARVVAKEGIAISAMGLGQEWNDEFLDELASATGGTSEYIKSASAVVRFLNDHIRNLSNVFAERVQISVAPDPDVRLESAFKLAPNPQALSITQGYIPLGSLQTTRKISVLLQFEMPADMKAGFRSIARLVLNADILANRRQQHIALSDISLEISESPRPEEPPTAIVDALGKLTLYRMQERAREAIERGDIQEATSRLENLEARLLAMGEVELAQQARSEAQQVAYTNNLSDKGRKALKYQTRHLLLGSSVEEQPE
ncbi:MAG: VWA domain-containing protein [Chloroflexi bacterium]|nr:VWA domain-containing protein [Chloroflexota bacterium]